MSVRTLRAGGESDTFVAVGEFDVEEANLRKGGNRYGKRECWYSSGQAKKLRCMENFSKLILSNIEIAIQKILLVLIFIWKVNTSTFSLILNINLI